MKALVAAALLLSALPAGAAGSYRPGSTRTDGGAPAPMALFGSQPVVWASAVGPAFNPLNDRFGPGAVPAVLHSLEAQGLSPQAYARLPAAEQAQRLDRAEWAARAQAQAEAAAALTELAWAQPASAGYPLLVARLQQLQGALAPLLDPAALERLQAAYVQAHDKLDESQRARFALMLERSSQALGVTLVELAAADLPQVPALLLTPQVAALRRAGWGGSPGPAWDRRPAPPPPAVSGRPVIPAIPEAPAPASLLARLRRLLRR